MSVYVFAYGSNLCLERLAARAPSGRAVATGRLRGYALRWHKRSLDGSGKCDALETGSDADLVWGAVYAMSSADKKTLDRCEGLGEDYCEGRVTIRTRDGADMSNVVVYKAIPRWIDPSVLPYNWYKQFVVRGAAQHALPPDYRALIEAIDAVDDPDASRHAREAGLLPPFDSMRSGCAAEAALSRRPSRPPESRR